MNEVQQYILTRTINLDHEQLLLLQGESRTHARVIYRGTWLTTERDLRDHLPRKGDGVSIRAPGRSLIESIRTGTIELFQLLRSSGLKRLAAAIRGQPA